MMLVLLGASSIAALVYRHNRIRCRNCVLCSIVLVLAAFALAWIHSSENTRIMQMRFAIKDSTEKVKIAKMCLSANNFPTMSAKEIHDKLKESLKSPANNTAGHKADPCAWDKDYYEDQLNDNEFYLKHATKDLKDTEASVWAKHKQWWFLTWFPWQ